MFFICTLNARKVIFVAVNLHCGLHAVYVGNGCQIFGQFGLKTESELIFGFPHTPSILHCHYIAHP